MPLPYSCAIAVVGQVLPQKLIRLLHVLFHRSDSTRPKSNVILTLLSQPWYSTRHPYLLTEVGMYALRADDYT